MKILRDGDLNKCRVFRKIRCYECTCIFVADDTEYKNYDVFGSYYVVTCPYCGNRLIKDASVCIRCNSKGDEI